MALQPPIRGWIRATSALLGTLIALVGVAHAASIDSPRAIGLFFIGWGLLMWLPMFARAARTREVVEEKWRRVVLPALLCLALGFLINGASWLIDEGRVVVRTAPNVARALAAVGSALWLVGFVLLVLSVYYTSQIDSSGEGGDGNAG